MIIWLDIVHIVRIIRHQNFSIIVTWYSRNSCDRYVIILSIISIKMQKKTKVGANLRFSGSFGILSFSDWLRICWIWSVQYYNFFTKLHIYEFSYKFDTVLYQFSRQERQIDVLYVSLNAWDSPVSSYTPSHLSFTVPFYSSIVLMVTFIPVRFHWYNCTLHCNIHFLNHN